MADEFELFLQGAKIYDSISREGSENMDSWSKANRPKLLAAYSYMERGIKAINNPNSNGVLYGILSKVAFDLLDIEKAERHAGVAVETDANDWTARYTLYLIRLNQYMWADQKQVRSSFGGWFGMGMTAGAWITKGLTKSQKKDQLIKTVEALIASFRTNFWVLPEDSESRKTVIQDALTQADYLVGVGQQLENVGLPPSPSYAVVVEVLSRFTNCGEDEEIVREVEAIANGNLLILKR